MGREGDGKSKDKGKATEKETEGKFGCLIVTLKVNEVDPRPEPWPPCWPCPGCGSCTCGGGGALYSWRGGMSGAGGRPCAVGWNGPYGRRS